MIKIEKPIDFLDISPYVRYVHHISNANSSNHYVPWRFIYDYELIFVIDGAISVLTDNESYELFSGDVHIMPPMTRHRRIILDDNSCSYYSIHFDFVYMGNENDFSPEKTYIDLCNNKRIQTAPIDNKLANRPLHILGNLDLPKKMHTNNVVGYIDLLYKINETFKKKEFAYEMDLRCEMLMLLKLILIDKRAHILTKFNTNSDSLSSITQYVLDNYCSPICFESICHIFGYSYSSFRKLFKQKSGKSPSTFLTDLRLEKAIELLYSKKYTIAEISEIVGYQDSGYFSRLFKQRKGCSPSEFSNNN